MEDTGIEVRTKSTNYSFLGISDKAMELWCRLIRDRRWGIQQKNQLLQRFSNIEDILGASSEETLPYISGRQKSKTANVDAKLLQKDIEWLQQPQNTLVTITCAEYPDHLRQLPDPPLALFCCGDITLLNKPKVAIVGSRRPSPVGEKVAAELSGQLAELGLVITSGMALGVDGIAHQACLNSGTGSVAVLGSGPEIIYPLRNRHLHERLVREGLLVSEYPIGVKPSKYTFPRRNRIVSGLSLGVVIVEAAERSGTLITARLAAEQNKEVMVVPGSALSQQYRGSHELIRQGAALVSNSQQILECLSSELHTAISDVSHVEKQSLSDAKIEHPLLAFIGAESTSVDSIILSSGLTAAEVSSMLLELELTGAVSIASDGGYVNLS